jgi:hypothetical protein
MFDANDHERMKNITLDGIKGDIAFLSEAIYNLNHFVAQNAAKVPYIGEVYVKSMKATCDYVINPVVIGGTFIGCDAIENVYHGLDSIASTPNKTAFITK